MKLCDRLIKITLCITTLVTLACLLLAYWDLIEAWFFRLRDKCMACRLSASEEFDDFADWDEE